MGYNQIFKGDPEQKRYYLLNNFSGGINTIDVDDVAYDNEFRSLVNVELGTKGMVQNRKGFGSMTILNYILDQKGISLDTGTYALVKVILNTNNIIEKLEEYDDVAGFLLGTINMEYNLKVITVVDDTIKLLVLSRDNSTQLGTLAEITASYTEIYQFTDLSNKDSFADLHSYDNYYSLTVVEPTGTSNILYRIESTGNYYVWYSAGSEYIEYRPTPIYKEHLTNIKTYDYANYIYFSAGDISSGFYGVVEYNLVDDSVRLIAEYNSYLPSAANELVLSSGLTGFNVLRENPLFDIQLNDISVPGLLGLYLTDTSGNYLSKIPSTGDFIVNVLKTGTTKFKGEFLKVVIKDQDENIMEYTLLNPDGTTTPIAFNDSGYFRYRISNLNRTGIDFFTIDIVPKEINKTYKSILYDVADSMFPSGWFLAIHGGDYVPVEFEDDESTPNYTFYKADATGIPYSLDYYTPYQLDVRTEYDIYSFVPSSDWTDYMDSYHDGKYFMVYYEYAGIKKAKIYQYENGSSTFTALTNYGGGTDFILRKTKAYFLCPVGDIVKLYKSESAYTYFYRWDDATGGGADFKVQTFDDSYYVEPISAQYFEIGNTPAVPIEPIDLKDIHIYGLDDRLIYYKGNTIWFSEIGQFDYLPNTGYMILPIRSDDEITNISYYRGSHIIFTKYKIFRFSGSSLEDNKVSLTLINDFIGCISPRSVASVNNSLYFMSEFGLYSLFSTAYTDGLENVRKIDKHIEGLYQINDSTEALVYGDQYWVRFTSDYELDTLKNYFETVTRDKQTAYVMDNYSIVADIMFKFGSKIYGMKDGLFYVYDKGYTDFMPDGTSETELDTYTYSCNIKTTNHNFGYPTHDKKYKSIFVKTYSTETQILYFQIRIDDYLKMDSTRSRITINEYGQIEYELYQDDAADTSLTLDVASLDNFDLDYDPLNDNPQEIHKIIVPFKGKSISLEINQKANGYFGIVDIGYLYKLGKVKEQR